MIGALDVMVVDDRPETVRFLTEFLLQRCRRVDVAVSAKEAMTALSRRKAAGETYHLILSDFVMPGGDGLSFLRELRLRNETMCFALITGYRSLNPQLEAEAGRLGVAAILDKPIELREVETLLEQATATYRKRRDETQGAQPFFGTSRVMRRTTQTLAPQPSAPSEALERRPTSDAVPLPSGGAPPAPAPTLPAAISFTPPAPAPTLPAPPAAAAPPQATTPSIPGYQRRPSAIVPMPPTSRLIRNPAMTNQPTSGLGRIATPQPSTTFTARIRRGVEGTAAFQRNAGGQTESGRMVSCTHCGRSFLAAAKPVVYTTVCVHCGQLQRIDPA